MSSLLGAGGDRKVTPGVTGSSRARAPIDPAVWYLGPKGPRGRIVVTRLKFSEENEYRLISAKPDLLYPGRVVRRAREERERATPREVQRDFALRFREGKNEEKRLASSNVPVQHNCAKIHHASQEKDNEAVGAKSPNDQERRQEQDKDNCLQNSQARRLGHSASQTVARQRQREVALAFK